MPTTAPPSRARSLLALAASAAATTAVAGLGGVATASSVDSWYAELDKPDWTPSGQVIGNVWTVLYAAQAVAAWLVWRAGATAARPALRVYGAQLLLNLGWTLVFFGLRRPGWALLEIAVLWIAIAWTIRAFQARSPAGAWLLVPYLAWVTFAAALNGAIWLRNR